MIDATRNALRHHRAVLLQAPTGAGKTVLAAAMANRAAERGGVFFICHRRELIDQTAQTFSGFNIEHGIIAAGHKPSDQPVQIASIDTLKNRYETIPAPALCIWDECHHLGAAGWTRVREHYGESFHVGLSATPQRLDGRGLDDHFGAIVTGPSVSDLIDDGYLAEYKLYSIPGVDLSGVHTTMGDYAKAEAEAAMDTSAIMGNIVDHWRKYADGKLSIAFGVTRAHSRKISAQFVERGIPSVHLDGDTPKDERKESLMALAEGRIKVVCNVGLFGEGYDLAANSGRDVTVGCVIDAAPTRSLGAYLQRCGRALRPQDTAIILDHAGNALRHGMPCDPREWTLKGRKKGERISDAVPPIRQCPICYAVHRPAPVCTECGHVYQTQARTIDEIPGELAELQRKAEKQRNRFKQSSATTLEELIALGESRGYPSAVGWARHIMRSRQRKKTAR